MLQEGKFEQVSYIAKSLGGYGRGREQETRSPRRWGGGFREWDGKETCSVCFVLTRCTVSWSKVLISFVMISPIFCCLHFRFDLILFPPPAIPYLVY